MSNWFYESRGLDWHQLVVEIFFQGQWYAREKTRTEARASIFKGKVESKDYR